ncbi:hypothetical protein O6H91_11G102900 [Diphasiastrum complanatum]|uniref:Uncharacterized protein n=1 Tax=Diphasiastrum complanatum TaxID=34168 RepID=A0ACC2CC69_DIPCM|nr:hypothetical protein O6H91_11G102900 [Diphasiastrum complanatum]
MICNLPVQTKQIFDSPRQPSLILLGRSLAALADEAHFKHLQRCSLTLHRFTWQFLESSTGVWAVHVFLSPDGTPNQPTAFFTTSLDYFRAVQRHFLQTSTHYSEKRPSTIVFHRKDTSLRGSQHGISCGNIPLAQK